MPANAIVAGSTAGWYYCTFSGTTAGTVFNNTYTSGVPVIPASPTAFSTTGPGSFTQVTSEVIGPSFTVPGGVMGLNGAIAMRAAWQYPNNANSKTGRIKFNNVNTYAQSYTTTTTEIVDNVVRNRGSTGAQIASSPGVSSTGLGASANAMTYPTVDTTAAESIAASLQLTTSANDFMVLELFSVELKPSSP